MKKIIVWTIAVLLILLKYYLELPPLNFSSPLFWYFAFSVILICFIAVVLTSDNRIIIGTRFNTKLFTKYKIIISSIIALLCILFVVNLFSLPIFNAKEYSRRITVEENQNFATDIKEVDFSKTPLLDKDSSQKLGDRKMGEFTTMVSQFYVSNLYTQINYNNQIIRVTPLEYVDFIKYITNRKSGIEGYITVNSVDGNSNLVKLQKGMKYMPSAYFFENLYRKLRFTYPTTIFDTPSFEIDNKGKPYWIIPTVKYKAIGLKKDITGAVILDPVTGESKKYKVDDIPSWVDHVYSAELIIDQVNDWGNYKNGYLNSIFGQKDVINTTDGYNYLLMDDDVFLYTGITSVSTDESNLGFILVNMRTKQTKYYLSPGAEEYSAMASAEGLVQEKKYVASFPLLINLNGRPTYLLSLKDNAGLVKMYAFIDVADYQKVTVNDSSLGINAAAEKYLSESSLENKSNNLINKVITIKDINTAVIDGTTYYYLTDMEDNRYSVSIKVAKDILPFIKIGDIYEVHYKEDKTLQIIKIK